MSKSAHCLPCMLATRHPSIMDSLSVETMGETNNPGQKNVVGDNVRALPLLHRWCTREVAAVAAGEDRVDQVRCRKKGMEETEMEARQCPGYQGEVVVVVVVVVVNVVVDLLSGWGEGEAIEVVEVGSQREVAQIDRGTDCVGVPWRH